MKAHQSELLKELLKDPEMVKALNIVVIGG